MRGHHLLEQNNIKLLSFLFIFVQIFSQELPAKASFLWWPQEPKELTMSSAASSPSVLAIAGSIVWSHFGGHNNSRNTSGIAD